MKNKFKVGDNVRVNDPVVDKGVGRILEIDLEKKNLIGNIGNATVYFPSIDRKSFILLNNLSLVKEVI